MKALIVDDHILFTDSFSLLLQKLVKIEFVHTANSAEKALETLEKETYDMVFLDLHMPGMNGIELCKEIRKHYPIIKIVVVSMLDDKTHIMKLFRMGVSGYFLKNMSYQELQIGIGRIISGETYYPTEVGQIIFNPSHSVEQKKGFKENTKLSRRELEIARLICSGMTSEQIGRELHLSRRTVDTHRANIYRKLSIENVSELVNYIRDKSLI